MKENEIEIYFGILPCYFNTETFELRGRNKFYHALLSFYFWIELNFGNIRKE